MSLLSTLATAVRDRTEARKRAQLDALKARYSLMCQHAETARTDARWRLLGKIRRLERELPQPRLI